MRAVSLAAAALIAGVTVVDGSFLVRGLTRGANTRPFVSATTPGELTPPPRPESTTPKEPIDLRCPMIVVNADPKLDARFARPSPTHPTFAIKSVRPSCSAQ